MLKVYTLEQYIKKKLKNKEFKYYYDRQLVINNIARIVYNLRTGCKLTQAQLAEKVGSSQSAIARIERGTDSRVPSLDLLSRIAAASNAKLNITFEQIDKSK